MQHSSSEDPPGLAPEHRVEPVHENLLDTILRKNNIDKCDVPPCKSIYRNKRTIACFLEPDTDFAKYIVVAQQLTNTLVQNGFEYKIETDMRQLDTTTSVVFEAGFRKYIIVCKGLRNVKDTNQFTHVAVLVAMQKYFSKKVKCTGTEPQGPEPTTNTMNPEDSVHQTEVIQQSENTEITQAVDVATAPSKRTTHVLQHMSTTEPKISLNELTERYIVIAHGVLASSDTRGQRKFNIDLPGDIYGKLDTSTSTALTPFTLIKSDIEITMKINANQAQAGRYVLAAYPCKTQAFGVTDTVYQALQREHVEIDVSTSADAVLHIKYENLRNFLPINTDEVGLTTGEAFTSLTLHCISPVNVVAGAVDTVPYQIIARFVDPFLTGMRYPIPVQGQGPEFTINTSPTKLKLIETVKDVNGALKSIPIFGALYKTLSTIGSSAATSITRFVAPEHFTKQLEDTLVYVGMRNKDKPVDTRPNMLVQPTPQKALCHGLGPIAATKMRLEMSVNTPHLPDLETVQTPESFAEMARIGGVQSIFPIKTSDATGLLLDELPAAPYDTRYLSDTIVSGSGPTAVRILPPVTYVSQLFQGYVGELEYEFIPIKTASHNFSIMVAFIPFDGTPGTTDFEKAQSCHYKVIDFRTNTTGVFTVPFITTSMFRAYPTTETAFMFSRNLNTGTYNDPRIGVTDTPIAEWKDPGKVCVYLLNPLNPTPIVANQIEVMVKIRAANNFRATIPAAPRFRSAYNNDATVFAPVLDKVVNANHSGTVPQGPIQTMNDDELPGEPTLPLLGPEMTHMEIHDDILNVNRRMMHYATLTTDGFYATVEGKAAYVRTSGLSAYIPIVVNDPVFSNGVNNLEGSMNSIEMMPRNIRDATSACFRFGRGGVIMSILNHSKHNLVITFLPPFMRPMYFSAVDGTQRRLYSLGANRTQIMTNAPDSQGYASVRNVPSVNPVTDIEIPFYGNNLYLDLQARYGTNSSSNLTTNTRSMARGPFQDVLARTLGTLKIQHELYPLATEITDEMRAQVTIRLGLSDDFKYHHFIGTPPVIPNFPLTIARNRIADRVKSKKEISNSLIRAGIESNPGPFFFKTKTQPQGPTTGMEAQGIWDFMNDLVRAPSELKKLRQQGDYFTEVVSTLKKRMVATFDITVTQAAALASTMLAAYMNPSQYTILAAVANLLVSLKIVNDEFLMKIMLGCNDPKNNETAQLQGPLDEDKREGPNWVIPLITAAFVEYCSNAWKNTGVDITGAEIDTRTVYERFSAALTGVNWFRVSSVMLVTSRIVAATKWLLEKITVWIRPSTSYLLLTQNPKLVENFMEDYAFIMNEINKNSLIGIRQCRDRFWLTLLIAYYLKGIMAKDRIRNPALLNAINDLIKRANELSGLVQAPPVRFEPFVVWVFGPRGVGKSTLLQRQLIDILEKHEGPGKFEHPNPVYTRSPTSQWWNGYHGQPIIAYDDVGAVSSADTDPILVGELMALKSCAVMPLEKPRLEEKETLMTSILVGIASNHAYLNSSVIRDTGAMDRRRDVLAKCDFTPEVTAYIKKHKLLSVASALPLEMTENNKHLRYGVYKDPTSLRPTSQDARQQTSMEPDQWLTYDEFMSHLISSFTQYYEKELVRMTNRYKDMLRLCPTYAKGLTDEASVKMAIMQMVLKVEESRSSTTMDTLRYLIQKLETTTPEYYKSLHKTTREQIETMAKIEKIQPQPQGVFNIDKAKIPPGHWMANFAQDSTITDWAKYLYDKLIPWHAPLYGKQKIEFNDNTTCVFCKEKVETVTYVCKRSCHNEHLACVCRAGAILSGNVVVSCPICDDVMEPIFIGKPEGIYNWMASLLATLKDIVYDPINHLPETWDKELFRRNLQTLTISVFAALALYGAINYSDIIFKKETYNNFYKYVGELPHSIYTVGESMYLRTKSGLQFLLCRTPSGEEYFIPPSDDNAQGNDNSFSELDIAPGEIIEVEIHEGKPKRKANKKSKKNKTKIIADEDFCELTTTDDDDIKIENKTPESSISFLSWLKPQNAETCKHDKKVIDVFLNTKVTDMACTLDGKLTVYVHQEDETEVELEIEKCCESCIVFQDRIVLKLIEFLDIQSPIWQQHINDSMLEYVPEVYLQYLKEVKNVEIKQVVNSKYAKWQQQLINTIPCKFKALVSNIWRFVTEHYKAFLSASAFIFCVYKGYKWYYNDDGIIEPVEPEGSYLATSQKTIKQGITRQLNNKHLTPNGPFLKEPTQAVLSRAAKINKNYLTMKINSVPIWGLGIYGHTVLVTRHNWHWIKFAAKSTKIDALTVAINGGEDVVLKLSEVNEVLDLPQCEHILIELPKKGIQCFANIKSYFPKGLDEDKQPTNPQLDELAYYIDVLDDLKLKATAISAVDQGQPIQTNFIINANTEEYNNVETAKYDWVVTPVQSKGFCLATFLDKRGNIIGMHVAGNPRLKQGYVVPMYREMIPECATLTQPEGPECKNLDYMYTIMDAPYNTYSSKIIPSPLQQDLYEPEKEPCIQSRYDPRYTHGGDPLSDGVTTIGQPTKPLDDEILRLAYEAVRDELLATMPSPYTAPPVSEYEAITAQRAPVSSSMNLNTSAGYPLAGRGSRDKQKRHYIKQGILSVAQHVKINQAYVKRTNGQRPHCVYWAHTKDELRPKEKLRRFGGTRVFSVPPLELVVNARRILLPVMDAFQSFPIETHHAIGLNPNSSDWRNLRDTLLAKGDCLLQMDYKNYSDAIPKESVAYAFQTFIDYYEKWGVSNVELENAIRTLFLDTADANLLVFDDVYKVNNGVLAGHPLTSIVNSIVNLILMTYMWIELTKRRAGEFFELTYIIVMGDDVVISLPKKLTEEFNCTMICKQFAKYDIVVTDSEKNLTGQPQPYDPFEKFEFLSRGFCDCEAYPDITFAPVKTIALFDCPLWINKGQDETEQVIQSIQAGLLLAFDHGPVFFDKYKQLLLAGTNPPEYNYFTWSELFTLFHGSAYSATGGTHGNNNLGDEVVLKKIPLVLSYIESDSMSINNDTYCFEENGVLEMQTIFRKKKPSATNASGQADYNLTTAEQIFKNIGSKNATLKNWECKCKYKCEEGIILRNLQKNEKMKHKTYLESKQSIIETIN